MPFTYQYPRPMVTADIVLFCVQNNKWYILLIERLNDPYAGCWALPGGFVDQDEDIDHAAARELKEETRIDGIELEQLHTFGKPGRDPRGHCVTVAYLGFANHTKINAQAGDDAKNLKWFSLSKLPPLAFDHRQIVEMAIKKAAIWTQ
jgi:8-oxo-dGTP diphosphatase